MSLCLFHFTSLSSFGPIGLNLIEGLSLVYLSSHIVITLFVKYKVMSAISPVLFTKLPCLWDVGISVWF